ncbi:MAG: tycC3 [Gemmatimonadetes bacterium]|nr:tycC3 [Gemmatimonadota bacterium]
MTDTLLDAGSEASPGTPPPPSIFVPSDFPLARVTQAELDALLAAQGGDDAVDDLYPLTPLQQGILFHALEAPGSGLYVEQLGLTVRGLDADAYARAWQIVVDRHTALRTAFASGMSAEPLQVVHREAEMPVERIDWSALAADELRGRLDELAVEDVRRGFDLAAPPLFRLTLVRTGADEHRVLITFHHLLLDGWSAARVFGEADEAYRSLQAGERIDLPEPRPFRDYVAWLLRRDPEQAEAFWRGELAGFAEPTELGVGRGSTGSAESASTEQTFVLAADEVEAVQALARGGGLTLNTVFQGALAVLLGRYSGRDDVVFGAVSSGRDGGLAGVEEIVGMTINTLPVRARIPRDARVVPWLRALQVRQMEARQHDQTTLHRVQRCSGVPADRPLFEVLYVFENYPIGAGGDAETDEAAATDVQMVERTNYPLTVTIIPGGETRLRLTYDAARLTDAEAERMAAHLRSLLAAMAREPDAALAALPMLDDDERRLVVETWNDTERPIPHESVHGLFAEWAARTPDATALAFEGGRLTYAELDAAATRLARRLRSAGAGPEVRVGVAVERSPALVAALLAVLKAGAAYVPLDAAYPPERLAFMLADADVSVLVVDGEVPAPLASFPGTVVRLSADEESPEAPLPELDPESLAHVLYTSGSTGTPKGVAITHRSVVRLARTGAFAELGPGVVMLHVAPAAFDASTLELWCPLLNGGAVAIHPPTLPTPEALGAFIRRHGVTTAWLTAGLFHQLVEAGPGNLRGLRQLMSGGDVLSPAHVARALAALPGLEIINGYGPTETTTFAAVHPVRGEDAHGGPLPIGRPIGNTRTFVLDAEMRPCAVGVAGELFVGGAGLARGYLGRAALTAERFVPDAVSGREGERLYRTGDRARWTDAGVLEFLGRLDAQVKVRGFRIEPGEVESALAAHPAVRAAAVDARADGHGGSRLVAWIVPADGAAPEPAELRAHLAARLPEFMLPSAFATVDALPLNANGKVDRRALPDPASTASAVTHRPPSTETELRLAAIWSEVLGITAVDAGADFFLSGGHSLLATQVASRVRREMGVEMPIRAIFDHPVLADLAAHLDGTETAEDAAPVDFAALGTPTETALAAMWAELLGRPSFGAGDDFFLSGGHSLLAMRLTSRVRERLGVLLPLSEVFEHPVLSALAARVDELARTRVPAAAGDDPAESEAPGDAPLSFAQERLWFIDRMDPGNPVYNVPQPMRMQGALDADALLAALREMVRRHAVLRTRFPLVDGRPVQRVESPESFQPAFDDLSTLSVDAREAEAERLSREWSWAPFDLARGPLFRARLLRVAADDHWLLLSMHHAVSDGWSMGIFMHELVEVYEAFRRGQPSPLPELPLTYADFAAWQRTWMAGGALERQLAWWREALAGAPGVLELPTDRPRPARQSHGGARVDFTVPADVADGVRSLARRERVTPFMVLLAGWNVLMARWAGQTDVVVGTPVAGRTQRDTEGLVGLFVNTLPLRADLSADPGFRALVAQVRETALGAFAHQDVPFEKLVEELHPERSLSRSPVFQVIFHLLNTPEKALAGDLKVTPLPTENQGARVDLTVGLVEMDDGSLAGMLEYATDLFDDATIERLGRHYVALLHAAAEMPDAPVSTLPMLAADERAHVLALGAATAEFPQSTTLHGRFSDAAFRTPDAPALTFGGETISYRELDGRASRLANHLRALGVGPESLVGLCVERSLETVVGILGILKAGGGYLPLDPAYPEDRLAYMLADSGASTVVTTSALAARVSAEGIRIVRLDDDAERIASASDESPVVPVSADALAYVIYTSGSTGKPKGVQVTHGNVLRLMDATDGWFGFGADDVWTLFHSYAFDFSVWEIWGALLYGGRVVVVPFYVSRSPDAFLRLLADERVTMLSQTPGAFRQLIRADEEAGTPELALRAVVFGGEALDPATLRGWVDRRGIDTPRLVNMYGITETTVHVTYRVVTAEDVAAGGASPIGVQIPDLAVHVLDPRGQPVPLGVPGEMHVGGAGVARGYLGRRSLTAQRFVPDPFSTAPGARLYRSGDRARRTADGGLEYLGRIDDQVKVRGFRIELGEIEAVLRAHPAVREAVVLVRGEGDERRLVAWTVADGEAPSTAEMRAHASAHLPDYMVPAAFVALDALPLTRHGKVDRAALPEPEMEPTAAFAPPRTPTEEVLAAVWADVLGIDRVGADDAFFALGGHSLLATRVVSRVRDAFGVEMPLRATFEQPTLSALAAEIDRLLRADAGTDALAIVPVERGADAPLSFAQERMWFVDRMEPGSPVYHMPFGFRLRGNVDVDALRRALDALVARHESLRTSFPRVDGAPVQRIHPPVPADFALHDLTDLSAEPREARADEIARDAAERAFDVEAGPLFRAALVRTGEGEHRLVLSLHHLICDGWSFGVLARELAALYGAFTRGEPSPLAELAVQYADFAAWQRAWLAGDVLQTQLGYWRRKLAGAPPRLELPTDLPRPAVQRHRGRLEQRVMQGDASADVQSLARREGATLFMTLLAAWSLVLARWAGQEQVVVGTPIAGRTRGETEPLIGLFLNSLALRTSVAGAADFRALLRRVRETTLEAYAHQDVPFERILEELRPERSLAHAPVFQVMLNLANFGDAELALPGLEVEAADTGAETGSKLDLTLYAAEWDGGLVFSLVYDADLFAADRMREMLAQLEAVLRQVSDDAARPLASVSLLTDGARALLPDPAERLSSEWRGSVPALFARHAAAAPDSVAVEDPRERWTYGELEKAANRIAHALVESGVRPGDVVAIWGFRSAALVRALLGTLKAGAAFLVLDPAYPSARLASYVRAAAPRAFLRVAAAGAVPDAVADALDDTVRRAVTLGEKAERDGLFGVPATEPEVEIGPDSLAYLSFTSGTTGDAKAVMGRHGSLTHFTPWLAETFALGAADRFSMLSGLAHDPLHRDVFTPLQLGAAVVAPVPEDVGAPGYLADWMRAAGITVAHLTPALGQLLGSAFAGASVPSLRRAFFVGDVLTRTDVGRLHALAPSLEVVNYYGSTETQRAVSWFAVPRPASLLAKETVPAGVGIPGVQLLVRTPSGAPAGVGEVGEIWMRSPHVALGYLGDEAMTAERFPVNPWTSDDADRLYRTGDLGRYRPDGVVEIAGRADRQVKVRGFRIEPGEIEAALRTHPAVRDAAVLARGEGDARRLVAWIVASTGSSEWSESTESTESKESRESRESRESTGAVSADEVDADALRAHLGGLLPEWMVPSAFVFLGALPLTPNGKLDRAALPDPDPAVTAELVAPRTETERALAAIWAELLDVETVGVHDHFFHLGGHSLLATRLSARVRATLDVELPLRAVFEHPTLAALAAYIDGRRPPPDGGPGGGPDAGPDDPANPSVFVEARVDAETVYPASFAQRRLWLLEQLEPGSGAYNLAGGLRLHGRLDVPALERAVDEIVRRHEALRTRIETRGEQPVQVVAPHAPVHLPKLDVPGAGDDALAALLSEEGARPMDLARGPLFRAMLARVAADDHALIWAVHHAVSDGWSTGVFVGELAALYEAFAANRPSPLPALTMQYGEHAERERRRLSGDGLDREVRWWKDTLEGAPARLELPTDRPRPAVQSYRGASLRFALPAGAAARIDALAQREAATPFMVVMAAFQAVLARWSGQDDVVVGTPIAGRESVEVEPLIGFFANTLALRGDLRGDPTFRALLGRTREAAFGAFEHQALPFERLVEELAPERSLGHAPVFQVMLAFQNVPQGRGAFPGLELSVIARTVQAAKFELSLSLVQDGGEVQGVAEYATDLFDAATVQRLTHHLGTLLDAALAAPGTRLSALPLMGGEELARLTRISAGPAAARAPAATLHGMFEAQAARTPDAAAVTFGGSSLSYAELDARANRIAHLLSARGAGIETPVAIVMERSPEMVAAIYGVLKAGAFYVPVEPEHPAQRIAWMLEDCGASVVLTQHRWIQALPLSADTVALDDPAALDGLPATPVGPSVDADALAYVIYTSGSTGRPKGAGNTHRGVVNRILWMQETFGLTPVDVVLQKTPFGFDVSVWELFWPLMAGARLAVAEPGAHREPARLSGAIRREEVTTLHFVPSMLHLWIDDGSAAACPSLRRVMSSGEALPADLRDRFLARLPGVELHNLYGPTEAAVDVTWHPCAPGDASPSVPLGRPIANTRIHVLDAAGSPCPIGVPGELFIAGVQVGRGYRGRAALTAERFLPDPFSADPGARTYRTGDRARWVEREGSPDGAAVLEYLGRLDFQVKLRGLRIEPGEVEAALTALPSVREAVAGVRPGPADGPRLVAWVVPAGRGGIDVEALRGALARRLPQHMVPAAFVAMDALPLTGSGKVDRRALPDPGAQAAAFVRPRTAAEVALAAIWAEVLRRDGIGAGDDFFALGGHSLLATLVVSRVRDRLGVEVPLRALFESPVLADLAARVEAALRAGGSAGVPPLVHVEGSDLPLSFAQERMWFIDRLGPGAGAYTIAPAVRLTGALHLPALERALGEVVRRHEPLRTAFPERDGRPVQRVAPAEAFHLPILPFDGDDAELSRRATELGAQPFDLERGPLFRAALLRLGEAEHVLLLAMHHAVSDGWSMGILFRELAALYAAFAEGRPSPLPDLPVRYSDYAVWQRAWLTGDVLAAQVAWWRERLAGAPALLELPADRPRPAVQSYRGARHDFALGATVAASVDALARAEGATPFMVLLAAFQAVLARWSGQADVVVGTPVAGRTRRETEGLIGLFVNTLALRGDLRGDPAFRELLARVREATLGAFAHQDVPFERLVEELQPARSLGHSPVFQVMFAFQNVPEAGGEAFPGLEVAGVARQGSTSQVDLTLTLAPGEDGGLHGTLEYATDLFDAATAERFAGQFATLLEAALRDPAAPVSALPLLRPDERADMLRLAAGPLLDADPPETVVDAFAAYAAAVPDAIAAELGESTVTYAELDARSNRLARLLRSRGVGPESPVALFLERSLETVVAWAGVLKAGGFVVPVDPDYPAERIAWMLEDSGARLALTQQRSIERLPASIDGIALDDAGVLDGIGSSSIDGSIDPASLAYAIYTSGSTGRPKGAAVTHANLAGYVAAVRQLHGLGAGDRVLHRTPASFDPSVSELWIALASGATLLVAQPGAHADPAALVRTVAERRATVVDVVPSLLAAMLDEPAFAGCEDLRLVLCGGEPLPPALATRFVRRLPHAMLVNAYGPAETTVAATAQSVTIDDAGVSIGTPLPGVRVYVLDARGEPCPVGVSGELAIGGALVGRGYRGRPALTAERFVPDPFSVDPGARMYRTGDRARWTPAGVLEFLGRLDFQVKIRGQRIEPGEVEAALLADGSVRAAVVAARPGPAGDPRLVAWVVAAENVELSLDLLRAEMARRLPRHLVPSAFVVMDALPMAPGGKVDRAALAEPDAAGGDGYVEPYTPAEMEMADVWSEVLGVARIGAADDFFALGGHSLLAVRLMARIRERFGREVPLAELFRSPTLGALAAAVERAGGEGPAPTLVALHAGGTRPPLFFVHPAGGTVFRYTDLARALGPDQPFYGIQARGVSDGAPPIDRMDEMVDHYAAAIRAAFPSGPYLVGGWSAGGPIAFALAARLREMGHDAPLAIVLDAIAPGHGDGPPPFDDVALYLRFAYDLVGVDEAAAAGLEAQLRARPAEEREAAMGAWLGRGEASVPAGVAAQIGRTVRVWAAIDRILDQSRLPRFDGGVLLIESELGSPGHERPADGLAAGWAPHVGGRLEMRTVPGSHATFVLEPWVQEIAREISRAVDAVLSLPTVG